MTQSVNTREGVVTFDQVMLGTLLLVDGKIVMLYQYQTLTSPDMVDPFRENSLQVLEVMFPQRGSGGAARRLAQLAPLALVLALGGALAGGFLYYRKRKPSSAEKRD